MLFADSVTKPKLSLSNTNESSVIKPEWLKPFEQGNFLILILLYSYVQEATDIYSRNLLGHST